MEDQPKNKGGRPVVPDEQRLVQRSIRMSPAHWAKIDAAGGLPWLRALIDKAKMPKAPPDR